MEILHFCLPQQRQKNNLLKFVSWPRANLKNIYSTHCIWPCIKLTSTDDTTSLSFCKYQKLIFKYLNDLPKQKLCTLMKSMHLIFWTHQTQVLTRKLRSAYKIEMCIQNWVVHSHKVTCRIAFTRGQKQTILSIEILLGYAFNDLLNASGARRKIKGALLFSNTRRNFSFNTFTYCSSFNWHSKMSGDSHTQEFIRKDRRKELFDFWTFLLPTHY